MITSLLERLRDGGRRPTPSSLPVYGKWVSRRRAAAGDVKRTSAFAATMMPPIQDREARIDGGRHRAGQQPAERQQVPAEGIEAQHAAAQVIGVPAAGMIVVTCVR